MADKVSGNIAAPLPASSVRPAPVAGRLPLLRATPEADQSMRQFESLEKVKWASRLVEFARCAGEHCDFWVQVDAISQGASDCPQDIAVELLLPDRANTAKKHVYLLERYLRSVPLLPGRFAFPICAVVVREVLRDWCDGHLGHLLLGRFWRR